MYELLIGDRRWSPARYKTWIARNLAPIMPSTPHWGPLPTTPDSAARIGLAAVGDARR
jgi:hypothetical protein